MLGNAAGPENFFSPPLCQASAHKAHRALQTDGPKPDVRMGLGTLTRLTMTDFSKARKPEASFSSRGSKTARQSSLQGGSFRVRFQGPEQSRPLHMFQEGDEEGRKLHLSLLMLT